VEVLLGIIDRVLDLAAGNQGVLITDPAKSRYILYMGATGLALNLFGLVVFGGHHHHLGGGECPSHSHGHKAKAKGEGEAPLVKLELEGDLNETAQTEPDDVSALLEFWRMRGGRGADMWKGRGVQLEEGQRDEEGKDEHEHCHGHHHHHDHGHAAHDHEDDHDHHHHHHGHSHEHNLNVRGESRTTLLHGIIPVACR
jgi:hypothetical protein